jgi:eukaryotic-like serine/threonine-protein kinase
MEPGYAQQQELFREALRKPKGPEREAFLDQRCAGDPELRARLGALLQAHDHPDPFLQEPVADLGDATVVQSVTEKPGDRIGPYKLLQEVGEGGCGVVYMAEQTGTFLHDASANALPKLPHCHTASP